MEPATKVNEWVMEQIRRRQGERMFTFIDPLPNDPLPETVKEADEDNVDKQK